MRSPLRIALALLLVAVPAVLSSWGAGASAKTRKVMLPTGQRIDPVGALVTLGRGPQDLLPTPDGRAVIVANSGRGTQGLSVVDVSRPGTPREVQRLDAHPNWVGMAFAGKTLFSSGGLANLVHVHRWDAGRRRLITEDPIPLFPTDQIPSSGAFGLDLVRDVTGQPRTVVGGVAPEANALLPSAAPLPACLFAAGMALAADGSELYVACQESGTVAIVDVASRRLAGMVPIGGVPYGVSVSPDGSKVYVSDWSHSRLDVLERPAPGVLAPTTDIAVGRHPSAMVVARDGTLYVANGNDDSVSVVDTEAGRVVRTISLAPYPGAPRSSMPSDLALSNDGRTLYVALGGNNAVAVIDTRRPPRNHRDLRYLPTAWLPTGVGLGTDGKTLFVTSAKGLGSGPNPSEKDPGVTEEIYGTLQVVRDPRANLDRLTSLVRRNNFFDTQPLSAIPASSSMYDRRTKRSPVIDHVLFVVRENKTFDQVLGGLSSPSAKDMAGKPLYRRGVRGDPRLVRYGPKNTPNTHAVAQEWVIADEFRAPIEESFTGHMWLNFAQLSDYASRVWTTDERNTAIGIADVSLPGEGSLLTRADEAGVSNKTYGWDGLNLSMRPENLENFVTETSHAYPTGLQYYTRDVDRIQGLLTDIETGNLPQFSYVWIPNDHTYDAQPGARTPQAMVADNDWAVGMIVDALSHSDYWKRSAVFFIEDDPQSGRDHIDSHRTVFLAASPWIHRGLVSHGRYDFSSIHRTVELLLGLPPTSQYEDKASRPLTELFRPRRAGPVLEPYEAIEPEVSANDLNPPAAELTGRLRELAELAMTVDRRTVDTDEEKVQEILDGMYHHGMWKYGEGLAPSPTRDVLRAERTASHEDESEEEEEDEEVVLGKPLASATTARDSSALPLVLAGTGLALVATLGPRVRRARGAASRSARDQLSRRSPRPPT